MYIDARYMYQISLLLLLLYGIHEDSARIVTTSVNDPPFITSLDSSHHALNHAYINYD